MRVYVPKHFEESRTEVLHGLVRDHPLAVLVTQSSAGLEANHIPMEIEPTPAPLGTLLGHVARSNPVWLESSPDVDALAIFQGPHGYVSPGWYPSKGESGKVVPTWNYAVVHAYGRIRFVEEAAWLRSIVERLTRRHEAPRAEPWDVTDAPSDFVAAMLRGIVGVEMRLTRLVGKWKLSQNRSPEDRRGVVAGLAEPSPSSRPDLLDLMRRSLES